MKRDGTTRVQVALLVFVVLVLVLGTAYFVTAPQRETTTPVSQGSETLRSSSTSSGQSIVSSSSGSSASTQSSSASSSRSSASTSATARISHVIIVLMENEEYSSVVGSPNAPYESSLASRYAVAANYTGVAHPSLPNYLALIAGGTFGVTTDCLPSQCSLASNVTTVPELLDAHHLSWREYAESMPANCSQVNSADGLYFTKHNPFVYFGSITGNDGTGPASAYCDSHVVSLGQFYADLANGALPSYSFITPNICDDAHSCPLSTGDQWLSTLVPKIINSSSFSSTALFIVYDEGSPSDLAGGGGLVPCILVSPFAKPSFVSKMPYSHYSLLATVEAIFGLGNLGRGDSTASPMADLFTSQSGLSG